MDLAAFCGFRTKTSLNALLLAKEPAVSPAGFSKRISVFLRSFEEQVRRGRFSLLIVYLYVNTDSPSFSLQGSIVNISTATSHNALPSTDRDSLADTAGFHSELTLSVPNPISVQITISQSHLAGLVW